MNAVQYAIFENILPNTSNPGDTLYNSKAMPTLKMPYLNIEHTDDSEVLSDDTITDGIPIPRINRLVTNGQEMYLTRSDLLAAENVFQNWFKNLKKGKVVTFILALTGAATGIITLYLLYKYTNDTSPLHGA